MLSRDRIVSDTLEFSVRVLGEMYQFLFNLPMILSSMLSGAEFTPVTAPVVRLETLVSVITVLVSVLDLVMRELVNTLEYHVLLTPAAVICLVLGRWKSLEQIQKRMDTVHTTFLGREMNRDDEADDIIRTILDDMIDEIIDKDAMNSSVEEILTTPRKSVIENDKTKDTSSKKNESGYLSELDMSSVKKVKKQVSEPVQERREIIKSL